MSNFPTNPSDGMIAEVAPDTFYQFSAREQTWVRVDGFEALGLATLVSDGLMAKEDLQKINGLLVPPPRISLTSEDCKFTFNRGTFGFRSSKNHLEINHELELRNTVGDVVVADKQVWQIHENTFGYEFRLNVDALIDEMKARGNLGFRRSTGLQGDMGDEGNPGVDKLDTGPQGADGQDGDNFPFSGTLTRETSGDFEIVGETNRAIVDITAKKTSKEQNSLILTRANIGNIDACPARIRPRSFESPFVVVMDDNVLRAQIRKDLVNNDCKVTCSICAGLFHLDLQNIVDQVFARFKELVLELKQTKENLANTWIVTLINVFNQQRDAICCALENCESRKRNQDERRYIESQRLQAAQSDHQILIDGAEDKVVIDLQADKDCPDDGGSFLVGDPCVECQVEITIDGKLNAGGEFNGVEVGLPPGEYVAEIEDCCIEFVSNQFNGRLNLQYVFEFDDPKVTRRIVTMPNFGAFRDKDQAKDAYLGLKFSFVHQGGDIQVWYPDSFPDDNSGSITLCIKPSSCLDFATDLGLTAATEPPDSCEMLAGQVEWYERGWRIGACCGARVIVDGQEYIVVKRSIGIDLTCGGGESLSTQCISKFIDAGVGHPAIAFPTVNGDEFAGRPTSGTQTFVQDDDLSTKALNKIKAGDVIETRGGNAATEIPFIIFPTFS